MIVLCGTGVRCELSSVSVRYVKIPGTKEDTMISQRQLEAMYFLNNPGGTHAEAHRMYRNMLKEWEETLEFLEERAYEGFQRRCGYDPNETEWVELRTQARHMAIGRMVERYLSPLDEPQLPRPSAPAQSSPKLSDANGWRHNPQHITPDPDIHELALKLWGEGDPTFVVYACALLMRRRAVGQPLPDSPEHPDYMQVVAQVRDAMGGL